MKIGSLFSGYGGLDLAVQSVFPQAHTAWHCEFDKAPSTILNHHYPDVPNLHDVTQVDWEQVEPVDIITGGSPCFTAGTLIDTIDGYRPIETLREGDLVRTHRGRYMPIVQTMNRTAQDTLTVRAMGTPAFTTTEEHPFYARTKGWKWNNDRRARERVWPAPEWVEAANLTNDHFVGFQIDEPTGEGIGQELAYLIGRWLGDGWVRNSKRTSQIVGKRGSRVNSRLWQVFICCAHHEADQLASNIADAGFNVARIEEHTVTKFRINSKELVETLQGFGQHAHGKRVPGWVYRLPLAEQRAIWQGWADADGSADAKGKVRVTTVSEELAHGMARIARNVFQRAVSVHKFPMPATCIIEGRTVSQRDQYQVVLPTRNREAFVEGRWVWVPVREVSPADGPAQVFNIGVRDDESYTAWGITVHNCQDLSTAGKRAGMTEGTRSNLWVNMREAIATIQPRLVVWENVQGALSAAAYSSSDMEPGQGLLGGGDGHLRALGRVLGDLTALGYDARWTTIRASDIGAPHHRARVFLIAYPADTGCIGLQAARWGGGYGTQVTGPVGGAGTLPKLEHLPTPQSRDSLGGGQHPKVRIAGGHAVSLVDLAKELGELAHLPTIRASDSKRGDTPAEHRRDVPGITAVSECFPHLPTPNTMDHLPAREGEAREKQLRRGDINGSRRTSMGNLREDVIHPGDGGIYGRYEPVVRRWETVTGTIAPPPTELNTNGKPRLNVEFAEWMMGLPKGWITGVPGLSRANQLKAIGNGVVPQQAAAALESMLA